MDPPAAVLENSMFGECSFDEPAAPRRAASKQPDALSTLVLSHEQCTQHVTRRGCAEQPARIHAVMDALHDAHAGRPLFRIDEMKSSPAMLTLLEEQLMASHSAGGGPPQLNRSDSVAYMESRVLPAVRAVHAPAYLEKLRSTCEDLAAATKRQKRAQSREVQQEAQTAVAAVQGWRWLCGWQQRRRLGSARPPKSQRCPGLGKASVQRISAGWQSATRRAVCSSELALLFPRPGRSAWTR